MSDHLASNAPQGGRTGNAAGRRSLFPWGALFRRIAPAGLFVLVAPTLALAQSATYFDRNNNVSVLERSRPDYQALGINVAGFQVYPSLTVAPQYNDNIFATPHAVGDLITVLTPTLEVNSNWSRDAFNLTASATSDFYATHSRQDTTSYQLTGSGRLDILTQSNVTAGFTVGSFSIPRSAENTFGDTITPIQYGSFGANLGALQTLNRVQFTEGFNYLRTQYQNNTEINGEPVLLDEQDNSQYSVSGQANYAISPAIAVFVSATGNDRVYDVLTPLNRDSSGFETTVGVNFDITRLVRGQVQVGYLAQYYASTSFHTVSGPAFHAQVEYFPSGLDTITLHLDRSVVDAVDPNAVSFLQSQLGLQLDHELLRNVILSGRAGYETDAYTGEERNDERTTASVRGTYFINRHLGLTATYSFLNEFSSGTARIPSYRENVVSLSLVVQQ
jgi:hypothetical protein